MDQTGIRSDKGCAFLDFFVFFFMFLFFIFYVCFLFFILNHFLFFFKIKWYTLAASPVVGWWMFQKHGVGPESVDYSWQQQTRTIRPGLNFNAESAVCLPLSCVHTSISKHIFACFLMFRDFSRYFEIFRDFSKYFDFFERSGLLKQEFPFNFHLQHRDLSKYFKIFRDFSRYFEIFWAISIFFEIFWDIFSKKTCWISKHLKTTCFLSHKSLPI